VSETATPGSELETSRRAVAKPPAAPAASATKRSISVGEAHGSTIPGTRTLARVRCFGSR
jgi:hypothetical protein